MTEKQGRLALTGFAVVLLIFILFFLYDNYFASKEYNYTFATYNGYKSSLTGFKKNIIFKDSKKVFYEAEISNDYNLKKGDTIWIKYSKLDPTDVEVIDLDYKKHLNDKLIK